MTTATQPKIYTQKQNINFIEGEMFVCSQCGKFFETTKKDICDNCGGSWDLCTIARGKYQNEFFCDLNIELFKKYLNRRSMMILRNPGGELFRHPKGLLIDLQSINLICTIYDAINKDNKAKFDTIICKDEYKFADYLDKMWAWIK